MSASHVPPFPPQESSPLDPTLVRCRATAEGRALLSHLVKKYLSFVDDPTQSEVLLPLGCAFERLVGEGTIITQ
jgi:hypothetical protein